MIAIIVALGMIVVVGSQLLLSSSGLTKQNNLLKSLNTDINEEEKKKIEKFCEDNGELLRVIPLTNYTSFILQPRNPLKQPLLIVFNDNIISIRKVEGEYLKYTTLKEIISYLDNII